MKNGTTESRLELDVTDFGPIAEANIQLRPLTVFIGPSNTGKSYLAILIYALHRFFAHAHHSFDYRTGWVRRQLVFPRDFWEGLGFDEKDKVDLLEFGRHLSLNRDHYESQNTESVPVPDSISPLLRLAFENIQVLAADVEEELRRCFGVEEMKQLVRRPARSGSIVTLRSLVEGATTNPGPIEYTLQTKGSHPELSASIPTDLPLHAGSSLSELLWLQGDMAGYELDRNDAKAFPIAMNALWRAVCSYTLGAVSSPAHYLPADRSGVMHAHRVVVRSLIQGASTAGLRSTSDFLPSFPGVMADFLENLIDLDETASPRRNFDPKLVKGLEESVLAGEVAVKRSDIGYPHFFYTPRGWKDSDALPLMNASSMVSELAPVVLFLRHIVAPGDLLIIEEPEAHLHPAMQAEFARHLALVAKTGVRVLVTTHSEWILEQFANLVRMSDLPEAGRKGLQASDASLRPDQFGAWLFKNKKRPKGSVVEEIRIDPEVGGLLSDYSEVARSLYNTWAEIGNRVTENSLSSGQ